jgi:hypothetical protein
MILIDIVFCSYYNLTTDYEDNYTSTRNFGKVFSLISVSLVFSHYNIILINAYKTPWKLGAAQHYLITNGLDKESLKSSLWVRTLNINFKFKILVLMALLVTLQNSPQMCVISMLLVQLTYMAQIAYCLVKNKKVYKTTMDFISTILVEICIFLLLLICTIFYIWEKVTDFK